jgi:hypothetical protein
VLSLAAGSFPANSPQLLNLIALILGIVLVRWSMSALFQVWKPFIEIAGVVIKGVLVMMATVAVAILVIVSLLR